MTDAIINPVRGKNALKLSPMTILVSSQGDLSLLCEKLNLNPRNYRQLSMSRVYPGEQISVAGPVVGAPYAVMIMEALIAWGARQIVFVGWCGSLSSEVNIGDILLPTGAFIDEGTSRLYGADESVPALPSPGLLDQIKHVLSRNNPEFHEGLVWSTDAVYRETYSKIRHFQSQQALAVEMEVSALFTVGKFRKADVTAILVVSDELATLTWKPGFKDERFAQTRKAVCEVISAIFSQKYPQTDY
ncbi:MAG: hypothetical protein BWK80_42565 [Desulfobacteraceae bacterium IS3]|nr:MAG: hypothetical protein BWK80_42565 [Desulfobacteraceae bacterium IS3]